MPANGPIDLAVIRRLTVAPGPPGALVSLELDLAVVIPDDHVGLLFPMPALALTGLRAIGPVLITSIDPVRPLALLVQPATTPVILEPKQPIARLLLLRIGSDTLYQDSHLPIEQEREQDDAAFTPIEHEPDRDDAPFSWPLD